MGFWSDFGKGFKMGWNGTLGVFDKIPVTKEVSGVLPRLHKGGKVNKTGNYRLRANETVFTATQMKRLKNAKQHKTKNKVIADVQKRRAKKPKRKKR